MDLTSTSPESAMAVKESANIPLRTSSSISDSNKSSKDSQGIENTVAHLQLEDTDSSQTAHATASDNIMRNSTIGAHMTSAKLPEINEAISTEPKATFMGLPGELRQRILYLVLSTLAPMSPENGAYVAQLASSRSIRINMIRRFITDSSRIETLLQAKPRRRFFTKKEVASYLYMQNLYLLNHTVHAEMRFVEQAWLEQYKPRGAAPLSLGAFAAWAAAPTPVNGILTLSLFDRNFIAHPPPEWEAVVRSIAADRHKQFASSPDLEFHDGDTSDFANSYWRSDEYLRVWREVIMQLPPLEGGDREATLARRYGIEAVELVDTMRCVLTPKDDLLEGMGLVHSIDLARLEILLMKRWGLPNGRVRVMDLMHDSGIEQTRLYPPDMSKRREYTREFYRRNFFGRNFYERDLYGRDLYGRPFFFLGNRTGTKK